MATNFPGSQDSFTNPTSSDTLDSPDHAAQHANVNDAVEAIELALLDGAPLHIDDANERVGIGTTSPDDELHVVGDVTIEVTDDGSAAQPEVTLHRGSASPADGDYLGQVKFSGKNDAGQTVNYAKITGKISDVTDTTEDGLIEIANISGGSQSIGYRFTSSDLKLINGRGLQVDGNVGVGTTSPSHELDVTGTINASSRVRIGGESGLFLSGSTIQVGSGASGKSLSLMAGAADRVLIDSSGNVGIGTTSPNRNLHVQQASSGATAYGLTGGIDIETNNISGLNILSPNTGYGRIYFGSPVSNTAGAVEYIHNATVTDGYMKFRAGAADRLFITGGGNVGIGTSSPTKKLTVDGDIQVNGSSPEIFLTDTDTNADSKISASSGVGSLIIAADINNEVASTNIVFQSDGVDRMYIKNSGNVGIGTNSPTAYSAMAFHLNGSSTSAALRVTNSTTGASNSDGLDIAVSGSTAYIIQRESADLQFHTAASERMRINSGGQLLGLNGQASAPTWSFISDPDTGLYRSSSNVLAFTTGGAIRALIYSGGFRIYTSGSYSAPSLHWGTDTNTGFYRHAENAIGVTTGGGRRTLWNTDANLYHYSQLLVPNMQTTSSYNTVRWNSSNGHLMRYSSTIEIKKDVVSIAPVLEYLNERSLIHDLRPVLFHEKDNADGTNNTRGEYLAGMIAEEVLEVAPELCYYDYDGNLTSYGIEALIPHLVAEIQRLSPLVEEMYGDANPDWVAPTPRSASRSTDERTRYDEAAAAQAEIGLVIPAGFETEEE